ncbi:Hypothetical_protein [Hexamita inflata]|uniref:Hypothetical_protein n=1 Tax=Hexamita inflata TaxID=28002 RepID=A0AA86UQZ6_9EUKA|nr:Hypothetical protein HINF_LOCUS48796 [Hexamita inflata]
MLFVSLLNKQIQIAQYYTCQQQIMQTNGELHSYCEKIQYMNTKIFKGQLNLLQNSNQMLIYSKNVKNAILNVQIEHAFVFSIFGFTDTHQLLNTQINVTIEFKVVEAALICQQCNLKSTDSSFVFIASGNRISGSVLYSESEIILLHTQLQFRINGLEQGGIVHKISKQVNILLTDVNVTGRFSDDNIITGNIAVHILDITTISLANFYICTNSANNYTSINDNSYWNMNGIINIECQTICNSIYFTYGLCLPNLQNGQIINNQLICPNDFIFVIDSCKCKQDFVLNGTVCVSILQYLQDVNYNLTVLNNSISLNISQLNNFQDSNISLSKSQLLISHNTINTSIQNNFSASYSSLTNSSQTLINKYQQQYDNMIQENYKILNNDLDSQIDVSNVQIYKSNMSILNNIADNEIEFDKVACYYSTVINNNIKDIYSQLFDSINNTTNSLQNKISQTQANLNIQIARILCIHGDWQNIKNVIVTGYPTTFCSMNPEATHVCDIFEPFRTITVLETCVVRQNPSTLQYDLQWWALEMLF